MKLFYPRRYFVQISIYGESHINTDKGRAARRSKFQKGHSFNYDKKFAYKKLKKLKILKSIPSKMALKRISERNFKEVLCGKTCERGL